MDEGLLSALGAGFQGIGAVASPQVAQEQAQERANVLPNMIRTLSIAKASRELQADQAFQQAVQGKVAPGMTSSALLDAVKDVDPSVLATSPAAHSYLQMAGQLQTKEAVVEASRQRLQDTLDRLNKPTDHVLGGRLIRSYPDGRTEVIAEAPTSGGSVRYSISPKDYTAESLKKYSTSNNVGDLVPLKNGSYNLATPGGADFTKTGDEFLATLPAQDRNFVKKLANYEIDPKTLSTRGGEREKYLKLTSQYDKAFDQKNYNTIAGAITRFATGTQGNTVRSLNVAIEHMDTAQRLGDALENNNIPAFNKLAQSYAEQTGHKAPTSFDSVKEILADEVVKGVVGGSASLEDRRSAAEKIKRAASPEQLTGVLNSWRELLGGQLKGLRKQYEGATRRTDFDERFLTPRAREALSGQPNKSEEPDKSVPGSNVVMRFDAQGNLIK